MTENRTRMALGRRIYGVGVMGLAAISLITGDFVQGQPVPRGFPGRTALAYAAGIFMLAAGAAIEWRRTAAWGAAALTAYYALIVIVVMNGRVLLTHYSQYFTYDGIAEQLTITAGALIVYAAMASAAIRIDAEAEARADVGLRSADQVENETAAARGKGRAALLTRAGQVAFGACVLVFGGAHFVYMNLTAPLVPKWLPPSQVFWGYATGVGFLAAGLALLTGVQARLAAVLLTAMVACFALLVHVPILLANHSSRDNWSEAAINFVIMGVAWVVADSLARPVGLGAR